MQVLQGFSVSGRLYSQILSQINLTLDREQNALHRTRRTSQNVHLLVNAVCKSDETYAFEKRCYRMNTALDCVVLVLLPLWLVSMNRFQTERYRYSFQYLVIGANYDDGG